MPLSVEEVTSPRVDTRRLPDALGPGALLLADLVQGGLLPPLAKALRLARKGGHAVPGLLAFALVFLVAGPGWGIKPFWSRFRRNLPRVAAIAGLRALPSSSAVGRALRKLDPATVDAFTDAVLTELPGADDLLRHPAVVHRDRTGQPLHVVDIDPSPQAFRQRDLIDDDEHPEPERLAPGVPGYTAQHRGEVRMRHLPCLHAGSGLWLGYRLLTGNGGLSAVTGWLTGLVRDRLARLGIGPAHIAMRGDKEFGAAGVVGAILDRGVHVLVRLAHYELFDKPEVVAAMAAGPWLPVESTGRRRREALDLGLFLLHPSEKAEDAGRPPVQLRVVVSRHPCEGKPDKGVLRDGYQLEQFGTSLSPQGWTAADVVQLYGGRSCIENGLACEDRELALGRTFSYHPAGQQWMVALGLWLWNWFTLQGVRHKPLPTPVEETAPSPDPVPPEASAPAPATEALPLPAPGTRGPDAPQGEAPEAVPPAASRPEASGARLASPGRVDLFSGLSQGQRDALAETLSLAFADVLSWPGWSLDSAALVLRCPQQQRLRPFSIVQGRRKQKRAQLLVRTDVGACAGCPLRSDCFASTKARAYKQIARAVSTAQAEATRAALQQRRQRSWAASPRPPLVPAAAAPPAPAASPPPPPWQPLPTVVVGSQPVVVPLFLPAAARQHYRHRLHAAVAVVTLGRAARSAQGHLLLAKSAAAKSRLRRTWSERNEHWQTDRPVRLRIQKPPT